jgi:hypothetical protein
MNLFDKSFLMFVVALFGLYVLYKSYTYLKWLIILLLVVYVYYKAKNFLDFRNRLFQIVEFLPLPTGIKTLIQMSRSVIGIASPEYNETSPKGKKRRVTGHHKKYVASSQKWKCKMCGKLLDHSYEVDHIVPLYKGGTNDVSNLQALCRNCHGKKTMSDVIDN